MLLSKQVYCHLKSSLLSTVPGDRIQLLPRLRGPRRIHYAVVAMMTVALLVTYYEHRYSLPPSFDSPWRWFGSVFFFEYQNDALGLVLLVPILYAAITLGWKKALAVMIALLVCITPYVLDISHRPLTALTSISFILIPSVLVMSVEIRLISNAHERRAIEVKRKERAEILRQNILAQEEERKRISRELHDGVAQSLLVSATVAHNLLDGKAVEDKGVRTGLEALKENSLRLVAEVRAICQDLRPSILDNLGVVSAIKWLVENFQDDTGVHAELTLTGRTYELDPETSLGVFRVVQEALNNVRKHARASLVRITVTFGPTDLVVTIEDDGDGFELGEDVNRYALGGKLGLLGMVDRARAIGGRLQIKSRKGSGTRVLLTVDREGAGPQAALHNLQIQEAAPGTEAAALPSHGLRGLVPPGA